jgi:PAS domain S-box-containing protein
MWGSRRAKALETRVGDLSVAMQNIARRAERLTDADAKAARDGAAVEEAFDLLRLQHIELAAAEERLRALLEELRHAEERVSEERAWVADLFDRAAEPSAVTDVFGIVLRVNAEAARLFGVDASVLEGKPLAGLVHPDDAIVLREATTALATEGCVEVEVRTVPTSDDLRTGPVVITGRMMTDKTRAIWRFRRTTEAKRPQSGDHRIELAKATADLVQRLCEREQSLAREREARESLQREVAARDRFIATLAHELRSPLNTVLGWSELLRRSKLDEAMRDRAHKSIERSVRAQAALIEDACDVSRISAGKLEIDLVSVPLDAVVRAAVDAHMPAAVERGVTLEHDIASECVFVEGDPCRLSQVVSNLIGNALKFTPHGGRITVTCVQQGARAKVEVRDTGRGIAPGLIAHVFDCFRQECGSASRHGLGLGLYIARELVERHRGTIRAESNGEGKGASFTVELPLLDSAPIPAERQSGASLVERKRPIAGVRILLVDACPEAIEWMTTLLRERGASVSAVPSANEALAFLSSYETDVVLTSDAFENASWFIRELRESRGCDVPALAMSSDSSSERARNFLDAGFDAHLLRPVSAHDLVRAVHEAADLRAR